MATVVSKLARTPIDSVQSVAYAADANAVDSLDSTAFALTGHNHDATYAALAHDHAGVYSPVAHDHAGTYAALVHNHDTVYARWRGASSGEPADPIAGDLWIDTDDSKVYFYNGAAWVALS